jgi:predicted Asp-tRNA(Asn)/Glu-tRNA(Gln) amidotransferase subunit C
MANEDFTYHKVSEKEKKEIKKQAKKIMDEFASKLEKIKIQEACFENGSGMRDEGNGWNTNREFRDVMLANAPFVDDDFIVAERGEWKK